MTQQRAFADRHAALVAVNLARRGPHVLRDGAEVVLRPLEPQDAELVHEVFDGLGPHSRFRRFLVPKTALSSADVRGLTAIDHNHHEAIVARSAADERAVGIARFVRSRQHGSTAVVAITVVDDWQARGLGTALALALARRARERGVRWVSVFMTHENLAASRLVEAVLGDHAEVVSADRNAVELVVALAHLVEAAPARDGTAS